MADQLVVHGAREHNLKDITVTPPAERARLHHRALRLGQVVARVRHDLRRGAAPLRRVALRLRAPVPADDGEARRRLDRRALAGDLDRPEDDVAQPALDGRHGDRDLRLPAAALRARRAAALPDLRPPDRGAEPRPDRRAGARAPRGDEVHGPRAGRPRPQGRVPRGARGAPPRRVHARQGRRRAAAARGRDRPRQEVQAHDRGRGRPPRDEARPAAAPHAVGRDRDVARRGARRRSTSSTARRYLFSENFACPEHGVSLPELEPRIFSFNSPHGACPRCTGLGAQLEIDPDLLVPDPSLSLDEGALVPWSVGGQGFYESVIQAIADRYEIDLDTPWRELDRASSRTASCTAPAATGSSSRTGTGWAASASTRWRSRGSSRTSSAATARPTRPAARADRGVHERSGRARCATARGSSPRCSRSRSAADRSTSSRGCR